MASLYKKPITKRDPKTDEKIRVKSKKWWGRYRDEHGVEKRVPLASDKAAAQAMLNNLVRKTERRAAGLEDPSDKHQKRPLTEHITDFQKFLKNKDRTDDYVNTTTQRVRDVIAGCKFVRINDISASRVQTFLADLREQDKSIATTNHYLRAAKMFTRWLIRDRRTNDDRLLHLSFMNADVDRRRIRRPLSMEEFALLIKSTEGRRPLQHVSGPDRVILYIVGAYTGYRRNEIGSVKLRSFDFASEPPTLTVEAGYSKHRQTDVIPLRKDFAERIQTWLKYKPNLTDDTPLFDITDKRTAEMIRKDLAAAREAWIEEAENETERQERVNSSFLTYVDDRGHYADFHALRKTFITNLSRAGVSPKTAQSLARHSDINLTMNTYTMLGVLDQAAGVEALPPLPEDDEEEDDEDEPTNDQTGATGTVVPEKSSVDGTEKVPVLVPCGAEIGAKRLASDPLQIAPDCTETAPIATLDAAPRNAKSPEEIEAFDISSQRIASCCSVVPEPGLEPGRPCGHWILNPARLPIPPLWLVLATKEFKCDPRSLQGHPRSKIGHKLGTPLALHGSCIAALPGCRGVPFGVPQPNILIVRETGGKLSTQDREHAAELIAAIKKLTFIEALNVTPVTHGGVAENQIDFLDAFTARQVIYFYLPSARNHSLVTEVGRFVVFLLLDAAAHVEQEQLKTGGCSTPHQVYLFIDEFQQLVSENFAVFFEQAASKRIGVLVSHQTVSQLKTPTADLTGTITGNASGMGAIRCGYGQSAPGRPAVTTALSQCIALCFASLPQAERALLHVEFEHNGNLE